MGTLEASYKQMHGVYKYPQLSEQQLKNIFEEAKVKYTIHKIYHHFVYKTYPSFHNLIPGLSPTGSDGKLSEGLGMRLISPAMQIKYTSWTGESAF